MLPVRMVTWSLQEEDPSCGWMCNSSICMKRRGLAPTGIAIYEAQERGFASVAHYLQVGCPGAGMEGARAGQGGVHTVYVCVIGWFVVRGLQRGVSVYAVRGRGVVILTPLPSPWSSPSVSTGAAREAAGRQARRPWPPRHAGGGGQGRRRR